ncbi:MAG: BatD family protein [Planctomycetota bacterium]|nr:BatD family protein [Planctomycetota bacterium]
MRTLLVIVLVGGLLAPLAAADEDGPVDRVEVAIETERETRFVGEVCVVSVRLGFDAQWFEEHAVPLFRQEVDLPLHLRVPWLDGAEGFEALPAPQDAAAAGRAGARIAVNDALLRLTRLPDKTRGGRTWHRYELTRRYVVGKGEARVLEAPVVRFAHATRFEEGFLDERVPLDRREATAQGEPLTLIVMPLPGLGRPASFVDAIGSFQVRAEASASEVEVGETLRVTVTIEGEGNLERLTPPAADRFTGFHVYGVIDDKQNPTRTIQYELAPLAADVQGVPAIELAYFDPTPPAGYRVATTQPIPLAVRGEPGPEDVVVPPGPRTFPSESEDSQPAEPERVPVLAFVLIGGLLVAFLSVLGWAVVLRRRLVAERHAPAIAREARVRAAQDALTETVESAGTGGEQTLRAYLAAELDCPPAALVDPELTGMLLDAGIERQLAARVAAYLDASLALRYGAPGQGETPRLDPDLVGEVRAAFERRARRG